MITTFLIVPAWSDQAGQCRIVVRHTDSRIARALDDYRAGPDNWKEAGLMSSRGELRCLDAKPEQYQTLKNCEPLMAGTTFDFEEEPAGAWTKTETRPLPITPWASVRGGKWHRTKLTAQNFTEPVPTLCGVTIVPLNVQTAKKYPDSTRPSGVCKHCLPLHT